MKLDYNPAKATYNLFVSRGEFDIKELVEKHGLNFSQTASTNNEAVCFTREPYAAVTFRDYATPRATAEMKPLIDRIDASQALESNAHILIPADKELWGFQKADISYALNQNFNLIADQPGLGKTPIAIAYANEIRARRVLCIVPANIRGQWEKRIREWTTMPWPYSIYPIFSSRNGVHPAANWTIVSYDLARQPAILAALLRGTYDLLIIDEGHYLKTADSKRTRAVFGGGLKPEFEPLASRCGAVMVLTGTPLPNRPREAYVLARNLCWDSIDFMSEDDFRERFNPSMLMEGERWDPILKKMETFRYVDERSGRHMELQNRMRANFMTRHMKHDVLTQLKLPVFDIIELLETAPVKKALEAERLLDIDPETFEGKDVKILGQYAIVRHQMGLAVAPQVADYADMLIDGGEEKLVVAGWHIDVLDVWQHKLAHRGVVRIDGRMSAEQKDMAIQKFINDPFAHVLIGNMQAMGTGVDGLQHVCSHILIGEPDIVPANNEQLIDRLNRFGQLRTVQAEFFVVPGSIMERVLAASLRKMKITHASLDAKVSDGSLDGKRRAA